VIPVFLELLHIAFYVSVPVHLLAAVGQWVIQFRLIPFHQVPTMKGIQCIILTTLSAFFLGILFWIFWPLHPELILYNDRISIPAAIAHFIMMPLWLSFFGYFKR